MLRRRKTRGKRFEASRARCEAAGIKAEPGKADKAMEKGVGKALGGLLKQRKAEKGQGKGFGERLPGLAAEPPVSGRSLEEPIMA